MTADIYLAGEVCTLEFPVATAAYRARCGIVKSPGCGSTGLALFDPVDDTDPWPAEVVA